MTEILFSVSPSVFSWSMLGHGSSLAAFVSPRTEIGRCLTHPTLNTSCANSSGCSHVDKFGKHFRKCHYREGHVKALFIRWPWGMHCLAANSRFSQKSWYALSIFDVSEDCNLSTDSPVRKQYHFQWALQKFQRFTGSPWAGTLSVGGVMIKGVCCDCGNFPGTRLSGSASVWWSYSTPAWFLCYATMYFICYLWWYKCSCDHEWIAWKRCFVFSMGSLFVNFVWVKVV